MLRLVESYGWGVRESTQGLDFGGRMADVVGAAEVAPVVFIGAKGGDSFALGGEAEVGGDDGEDAVFVDEGENARRDDVNAGEG